MYKLSPSSMNLIEDCPRCFWLQIVKKIKRPSGAFPSLPSGVDKMLKEHFDRFRDNNDLPLELKKRNMNFKLFKENRPFHKANPMDFLKMGFYNLVSHPSSRFQL